MIDQQCIYGSKIAEAKDHGTSAPSTEVAIQQETDISYRSFDHLFPAAFVLCFLSFTNIDWEEKVQATGMSIMHGSVRTWQFCMFHMIGVSIFRLGIEHAANTSDKFKRLCMVAEQVSLFNETHSPPAGMAATQCHCPVTPSRMSAWRQ